VLITQVLGYHVTKCWSNVFHIKQGCHKVFVAYGSGCLRKLLITKFQSQFKGLPVELRLYPSNILLGGVNERHCESKLSCPRAQCNGTEHGTNPEHLVQSRALTIRSLYRCLHSLSEKTADVPMFFSRKTNSLKQRPGWDSGVDKMVICASSHSSYEMVVHVTTSICTGLSQKPWPQLYKGWIALSTV